VTNYCSAIESAIFTGFSEDPPLAAVEPTTHIILMRTQHSAWLKVMALMTVGALLFGFVSWAAWPGTFSTISLPIGFTLWWLLIKIGQRNLKRT
jgi:hydrogenase/urease accessory protein HupE